MNKLFLIPVVLLVAATAPTQDDLVRASNAAVKCKDEAAVRADDGKASPTEIGVQAVASCSAEYSALAALINADADNRLASLPVEQRRQLAGDYMEKIKESGAALAAQLVERTRATRHNASNQ